MILSIIGPSGCGKGTQAKLLAEKFKIAHLSMGDILREAYRKKTSEGLEAEKYWGKGIWVPDELTYKIFSPVLNEGTARGGVIMDGFPREIGQAEWLDDYLGSVGRKLDLVLFLQTPEEVCRERIRGRVLEEVESGAVRKDETEEVIEQRFVSYKKTIDPILSYYKERGILAEIDNTRSIDGVFQQILEVLQDRVEELKS